MMKKKNCKDNKKKISDKKIQEKEWKNKLPGFLKKRKIKNHKKKKKKVLIMQT